MAPNNIGNLRTKITRLHNKWLRAQLTDFEEVKQIRDEYEELLSNESDESNQADPWLSKIEMMIQYNEIIKEITDQIEVLSTATNPRIIKKEFKILEKRFEMFQRLSQQSLALERKMFDIQTEIDILKEDLSLFIPSPSTENGSTFNGSSTSNNDNGINNDLNQRVTRSDTNQQPSISHNTSFVSINDVPINDNIHSNAINQADNQRQSTSQNASFLPINNLPIINNSQPDQVAYLSNNEYYTDVPVQKESLKMYSGNIMEYREFRLNAHRLIVNNRRIPDPIDKLRRLKDALPVNVKYHLSHLGSNPEDLSRAIEILDKVCGSPAAMSSHLLNQLYRLPTLQLDTPMNILLEYRNWIAQAITVISDYITEESKLMTELKKKISRQVRQFGFHNQVLTAETFQLYIDGAVNTEYDYAACPSYSSKAMPGSRSVRQTAAINTQRCNLCDDNHSTLECAERTTGERLVKIIKDKKLCIRCLKPGHFSKDCRTRNQTCDRCTRRHPTYYHEIASKIYKNNTQTIPKETAAVTIGGSDEQLSTANLDRPVIFRLNNSQSINKRPILKGVCNNKDCELLIDFGSRVTLISENLVSPKNSVIPSALKVKSPLFPMPTKCKGQTSVIIKKPKGDSIEINNVHLTNTDESQIIIGTDNASKLLKENPSMYVIDTRLGEVKFYLSNDDHNQRELCSIIIDEHNEENNDVSMPITKSDDGNFMTKLPFLSNLRPRNNYQAAIKALDKLQHRLRSKRLFDIYEQQVLAYEKEGFAERVNSIDGFFMPHNGVIRDSASTPLRVVFNASFGCGSLNDYLWKGVATGLDIIERISKFRNGQYAVIGDISKAFLQIGIDPDHRKYLKFLWRTKAGEIIIFQMKVLPFGLVSSPAILTETIRKIIEDEGLDIKECIYMDDVLIANDSKEKLLSTMIATQASFKKSGFTLHKILSNSEEINKYFNTTIRLAKVLGLNWCPQNDTLSLNVPTIESAPSTKRELLSLIGQFYDPLGVLDPWKLNLRLLFRKILKLDWEELLPNDIVNEINTHLIDIPLIKEWNWDRALPTRDISLIGFSDASKEAYGYVIFIKNNNLMHYLIGKSKLAPKEHRTIVHLELIALLELSQMMGKMSKLYENVPITICSDSEINLKRLQSSPNKFDRSIATKILKILRILNNISAKVKHISGEKNPADIYSRLTPIKELSKNLPFIVQVPEAIQDEENDYEIFQVAALMTSKEFSRENIVFNELSKCSSSKEMIDVIKIKYPNISNVDELMNKLYMIMQNEYEPTKVDYNLELIDGIYRLNTRINEYRPIWIPKESPLAPIILSEEHETRLHSGVYDLIAAVRDKFYIPGLSRLARNVISKCRYCQIMKKKAVQQPHGELPSCRRLLKVFEAVAIDMFGPSKLRNGNSYWGLVLTCMASRMVKLAPVTSLSAEATMGELHNIFCSIGVPAKIYSDNGTNFVKINRYINENYYNIKDKFKQSYTKIEWHFSPPGAPWFNGTVERMVSVIKRCLNVYNKEFKSINEVRMAFSTAEAIINSRPIFREENRFISPFEVVYGRSLSNVPWSAPDIENSTPKRLKNQLFTMRNRFENLWRSQYLWYLAKQNQLKPSEIKVGQEVMIPTGWKHRRDWPIAKITKVHPGKDDIVRVVTVVLDGKEYIKPINGLISLSSPGGEL